MAFFPAAVATTANLYTAVNSLQTTLSTALGTGDTSVVLASATGFPTAGAVVIGNEVIFYTGVSGATLTGCTRGADGTTAATHSVGVPVGAAIVAFHHNGLVTEVIAVETFLNTKFGTSGSAYGTAKALQTNATTGIPEVSSVTNTELGYLSGVTSAVQTQMDLKAAKASPTFTGTVTVPTPFTVGAVSVTATGTEMNYLVGVTSAIQTQLGTKAADSAVVHNTGIETIGGAKTFSAATTISNSLTFNSLAGGSDFIDISGGTSGTVNIRLAPSGASSNAARIRATLNGSNTDINILTAGAIMCTFDANGDIYTVAETDYSGTSTAVGWSSTTTKKILYKKIGKMVWVRFSIDGTSNSTSTSFTLPYAAAGSVDPAMWTSIRARDNNVDLTTAGHVEIDASGSTATCYKDAAQGAWTASARKIVSGQFFYQTA